MWKKYDDEFKRNALQKVFDGQSVRSVAELDLVLWSLKTGEILK